MNIQAHDARTTICGLCAQLRSVISMRIIGVNSKMKYEVEALNVYQEKNIMDSMLKKVPKAGERFTVDKDRLAVLLGNNAYKETFVKLLEELKVEVAKIEVKAEKAIKKTTKKSK